VNDTSSTNNPPLTAPPVVRILWTCLILATLAICYFSQLGVLGFVGPDEPRYAWIARAMAETGDWVTPRLYGQPWFEKPVLYYWGAALSFKVFGVSEAAARLPSAASALLATLAMAWLAWRTYGLATARWFLLLLPTTVGMLGFSHAAATDMPFSGMLTVAMVCATVALELTRNEKTPTPPRTLWFALLLFGVFLGMAVLAKGPAAIILCAGAVLFWAIFAKNRRRVLRLLHPVTIAGFCVTALPWYILCAHRNPDFLRIFIVEHNFKRFLTPEFQHVQPFWFYLPVLLVAFLPWAVTLVWSTVAGVKKLVRIRYAKETTWFLICWAWFCVMFFSVSHSKLPGYILPAFPAIGLLVARSLGDLRTRLSFWIAHLSAGVLFLVFATAAWLIHSSYNTRTAAAVVLLFAIANLMITIFGGLFSRRPNGEVLAGMAVVPILAGMLLAGRLLPEFFHSDPSGRTIARAVQQKRIPANQLAVAGMNRSLMYSLSFYLHEEVRNWDAHSETGGYLLTSSKNCERIVDARFFCELQPFDSDDTGRFLYLVLPIAHGN
jgi:4-amino-4-deoxy-L-arabinose transferase-like glycosyltransferase